MNNKKFERLEKRTSRLDNLVSENKKAHKYEGAPIDQRLQKRFARAAFTLNQYGDGDNWSYDDVGQYGFEEVVKLQDEFNAGKGRGHRIAKRVQRRADRREKRVQRRSKK